MSWCPHETSENWNRYHFFLSQTLLRRQEKVACASIMKKKMRGILQIKIVTSFYQIKLLICMFHCFIQFQDTLQYVTCTEKFCVLPQGTQVKNFRFISVLPRLRKNSKIYIHQHTLPWIFEETLKWQIQLYFQKMAHRNVTVLYPATQLSMNPGCLMLSCPASQ